MKKQPKTLRQSCEHVYIVKYRLNYVPNWIEKIIRTKNSAEAQYKLVTQGYGNNTKIAILLFRIINKTITEDEYGNTVEISKYKDKIIQVFKRYQKIRYQVKYRLYYAKKDYCFEYKSKKQALKDFHWHKTISGVTFVLLLQVITRFNIRKDMHGRNISDKKETLLIIKNFENSNFRQSQTIS